ncbi:MAG: TetR/AcrR family transcriptional regulator [Clostridia bacterium]|jgi:AcrR family transcriptional regulator|nr:TetR/AcrR family transcriptional regulator [Spirochaetia bacterium]
MKHEDILAAAFRVWGREAYRKMSLTEVATELGVTKPALYRHFRDKDQLLAAMHTAFFDRYAQAMKLAFPSGLAGTTSSVPLILRLLEALSGFFGARPGDLAFMFARIMRFQDVEKTFAAELAARGVTMDLATDNADARHNQAQMAVGSCFFMVALFHLDRLHRHLPQPASRDELAALTASILDLAAHGLGQRPGSTGLAAGSFLPADSPAIDYTALEARARLTEQETAAPDGLLPAVAAVVAEVGSWNASMDMVAKRSGLSKSGLYSHFKSKEDMLLRLFSAEFERISDAVAKRLDEPVAVAERLYLAMATAAEYLLARPDILIALDWLRMQRLGVPDLLPPRLLVLFSFLGEQDSGLRLVGDSLPLTVRWILFLTIHQLMRCTGTKDSIHEGKLRALHKFMLNGLTGG